ncbi:Phosphoesterase RecJ domain-containing protein [Desulfonema limicola]|uniref:Phosphoesterase RecJ domain-containing protein n=1 Tax=Desulfonema limicola TaxID=45656 RepID=A0A975B4J3_9BACT|nr:DHH family phosphoesterase [Desulfonema limicola]QTA78646.1 Phosphoesterase RecJ domain-containing protein [Desulfonema limicola]
METIIHQLKLSHNVFIGSHINPDGDAVGSLTAMALSLVSLGKKITMYNQSPIPAVYSFLPWVDRIINQTDIKKEWDTAVILDCGNIERIGRFASQIHAIPTIINIDHHVTNTGFGNLQYIDTSACSTAEIVYRIIKKMGVSITKDIAASIYTGILTDTGSFRFANTNRAAFSICDKMVAKGVNPYDVAKYVYGTYSLGRMKLLNLALDSIEIVKNGKLSFMTLTRSMLEETGTQPEDIDGMINYAKRIEDVRLAVLIQESQGQENQGQENQDRSLIASDEPGLLHVSLRSDGSIDVSDLASFFGGGGHQQAAGFCSDMAVDEIKRHIIKWLEQSNPELCRC